MYLYIFVRAQSTGAVGAMTLRPCTTITYVRTLTRMTLRVPFGQFKS